MSNNEIKYECRNSLYFKANDYSGDDIVLVNEKQHYPNGEIKSNLRIIQNYQKEIFIHKEGYRKYHQKRVWAPKREMTVYHSTEAKLEDKIKMILGIPLGKYVSRRQLCRSPYVYGTDISTSSIIKKRYKDRYPETVSDASVAVIDIETSVVTATEEIIAISLTFGDRAILATTKFFIGDIPNPEHQFYTKLDQLTPVVRRPKQEGTQNRGCNVEFVICDTPALAVKAVFKRAHEWRPDFITGWNSLSFDIPRILACLEKENYDPADVLSDPIIPKRFRQCKYIEGAKVRKAESGRTMPLAGYEQWHWLSVPASFYFLDSMCLYYQIRRGSGLEENYKLDTILNKVIGRGKVGIPEAEHLDGIDKHRFMQTKYKIEYLVYNLFDCVGVELLDEATRDIRKTFPVLAGVSDYGNFTSNPKRLCDALHFFVYDNPEFDGVLGTVSDQLRTDIDQLVPSLSEWIVALPTERLMDVGMQILEDIPNLKTKVRGHSADIDITSSYPNTEITMNVSKDTTVHELNRIQGLFEEEQRTLGLNMIGGKVNSLDFARRAYKLLEPKDVYRLYMEAKK